MLRGLPAIAPFFLRMPLSPQAMFWNTPPQVLIPSRSNTFPDGHFVSIKDCSGASFRARSSDGHGSARGFLRCGDADTVDETRRLCPRQLPHKVRARWVTLAGLAATCFVVRRQIADVRE